MMFSEFDAVVTDDEDNKDTNITKSEEEEENGNKKRGGGNEVQGQQRNHVRLAKALGVSTRYVRQGREAITTRQRLASALLSSRRLPERGWDEASIEMLLAEIAAMDSNNFLGNAGVGEREGRVISNIVRRRHFRLAHGMGRSGDVNAEQPKAAGSSALVRLAEMAVRDAMREAGALPDAMHVLLLPLATGMALALTMLALRHEARPRARYVIFPRVDQKTCLKVAASCGYELVLVPNKLEGDQLVTDVDAVRMRIESLGADNVACVLCTTSCFAPRVPDDVVGIATACREMHVPCIVNNAYGVQARQTSRTVCAAARRGRVDAIVQSTDKNFMVPVGGAVVTAAPTFLERIGKTYPGRASIAPVVDVFVTLLELGRGGWRRCLDERERLYDSMRDMLAEVAREQGERVLETPGNPISMAISLQTINGCMGDDVNTGNSGSGQGDAGTNDASSSPSPSSSSCPSGPATKTMIADEVTFFGSMLFSRLVSGTRAVSCMATTRVAGHTLVGFGAHDDAYPVPYLAAAAAIGATNDDAVLFIKRLRACFSDYRKRQRKMMIKMKKTMTSLPPSS